MSHLSERLVGGAPPAPRRGKLKEVLAQVERELITQTLERRQGNRTHAAEELGMSRWGLVQKIKEYGLGA